MILIQNALVEELKNNLISILTFLSCIIWLCQRNGWIEVINSRYQTIDSDKILAPSIATLVLPFLVPSLFMVLIPLRDAEIRFLLPSITTGLTFILAQYLLDRRENLQAGKKSQETKKKVISFIYQDFSIVRKVYRKNLLVALPPEMLVDRQTYYVPEPLSTYNEHIKSVIREFTSVILEIELFDTLYDLSR